MHEYFFRKFTKSRARALRERHAAIFALLISTVESKLILKVGTRVLNLVLNLVHRQARMVETPSHFQLYTVPLGNI